MAKQSRLIKTKSGGIRLNKNLIKKAKTTKNTVKAVKRK